MASIFYVFIVTAASSAVVENDRLNFDPNFGPESHLPATNNRRFILPQKCNFPAG